MKQPKLNTKRGAMQSRYGHAGQNALAGKKVSMPSPKKMG